MSPNRWYKAQQAKENAGKESTPTPATPGSIPTTEPNLTHEAVPNPLVNPAVPQTESIGGKSGPVVFPSVGQRML